METTFQDFLSSSNILAVDAKRADAMRRAIAEGRKQGVGIAQTEFGKTRKPLRTREMRIRDRSRCAKLDGLARKLTAQAESHPVCGE